MKIVLPGGTGQVGRLLAAHFKAQGDEVVLLGRKGGGGVLPWDGRTLGPWAKALDGADAVINLAGRSVNCRQTEANKKELMDSRVDSTRVVGEAIAAAARPPRVWIQMSTGAQYAHRFADQPPHGEDGPLGGGEPGAPKRWDFSVDIARAWEKALFESPTPATRKVALRADIVMSPGKGGIFDIFLNLTRFGLGGTIGDGRQMISWIHGEDFLRVVDFLLERDDLEGTFNVGTPHPLPQKEFMAELRKAYGMPLGLPATKWMMDFAAWVIRTESELTLKSRYTVPARLTREGFTFRHPTWGPAVRTLVEESKKR
jgi:uncharacterized protein (TIGR01777 family)